MGGGTFDYRNYSLQEMAQTIRTEAENMYVYPLSDPKETESAELLLFIADFAEYCGRLLHHADYYLAGDTVEESFIERVKVVLEEMKDG